MFRRLFRKLSESYCCGKAASSPTGQSRRCLHPKSFPLSSGPTFTSFVAIATIPRLERVAFYCVRQGKQKTKGVRLRLLTCPRDGLPPFSLHVDVRSIIIVQ